MEKVVRYKLAQKLQKQQAEKAKLKNRTKSSDESGEELMLMLICLQDLGILDAPA